MGFFFFEQAPDNKTAFTQCSTGSSAQTNTEKEGGENEKVENCCHRRCYGRGGTDRDTRGADQQKRVFMELPPVTRALCSPPLGLTEAILLADCWAGTDPSSFSATCMKLKKQASVCNLLSEIPNGAGFLLGSSGEGKMLALSGGDVRHRGATSRSAALCCVQAYVPYQEQQHSFLHQKGTSPNLPSGSPQVVERKESLWKPGRCFSSSQCTTPGLHHHRTNLNSTLPFSRRWLTLTLEGGRHPSFAGFISSQERVLAVRCKHI